MFRGLTGLWEVVFKVAIGNSSVKVIQLPPLDDPTFIQLFIVLLPSLNRLAKIVASTIIHVIIFS
jgi:hypothetical protein